MKTACAFVLSPEHVFPDHPEGPDRFARLGSWQVKPYAGAIGWLDARPARLDEVAAVHSQRLIHALAEACKRGPGIIDVAPTYVTPSSFVDALTAAGGALACTRAVLDGSARNAFAIVRPPGHHAEPDRATGFCLFNNLAIGVRAALDRGIQKILIFDFDAHHGNGTQAAFQEEGRVTYFSTHQENIYPGSGWIEEAPNARGRILNLPLPSRAGDAAFARIAQSVLTPLASRLRPEMIFVSAGFDAHWNDPLTALGLSSAGFFMLARQLVALAEEHCRGRVIFVLEGGYRSETVAAGVDAVLTALTGAGDGPATDDPSPYPEPDIHPRLDAFLRWHGLTNHTSS